MQQFHRAASYLHTARSDASFAWGPSTICPAADGIMYSPISVEFARSKEFARGVSKPKIELACSQPQIGFGSADS